MFGQLKDKALTLLEGTYNQDKKLFKEAFSDVDSALKQPIVKEFNKLYQEFKDTRISDINEANEFINEGISMLKSLDKSVLSEMSNMLSDVEETESTAVYETLDALVFGAPSISESLLLKNKLREHLTRVDAPVISEELKPVFATLLENRIKKASDLLSDEQIKAMTFINEGGDALNNYYNGLISECLTALNDKLSHTNDPEIKSELSEAIIKLESMNEPSVENIEQVVSLKESIE